MGHAHRLQLVTNAVSGALARWLNQTVWECGRGASSSGDCGTAGHRRQVGWAVPVTSGHAHRPPKPAFSPFPVNPLLHCFLLLTLALSGDSWGWGGSDRHRQDQLLILAPAAGLQWAPRSPPLHGAVVTRPPFPLLALLLFLTFWLRGSLCSTNSPGLLSSLHRKCFEGRAPLPLLQPWLVQVPLRSQSFPNAAPPRSPSQVSVRKGEISLWGQLWSPPCVSGWTERSPLTPPCFRLVLGVPGSSALREGCQNL